VRFFGGALASSIGFFPLSAIALGFFPLEQEEKTWGDGGVCEWICRHPGAILLDMRTHWEWWLDGVLWWNTKWQGFLSECEGFFIEQCSWLPSEDFLWILCQETRSCTCSAKIKVPEFVQKQ
jgi:hypothetical protein